MANKLSVVEDINYYQGTFDTKVYKDMHDAILSYSIPYIEIEGSVRAGKDVLALNCYAEFLMLTPDKLHLVTHVSMSSAKETVYEADGFGLKYLIPHGELITRDNRDIFKFKDWSGIDKEVHFFGLSQYNDHEKFRGVSYGSHYANESTRQHIDGLKNARDRTIASKWRKIIYTQNPVSPSNPFYTDIESPLIAKSAEVARIIYERDKYKDEYDKLKREYDILEGSKVRKIINDFLFDSKKTNVSYLTKSENLSLRKKILVERYRIRQDRETELYKKYGITSKHYAFTDCDDNPNNVKNGINFRYFHLTMNDNPSLTPVKIEEAKSSYDQNSLHYKRDILGMRALGDGAIFDNITNENYYYIDLPKNGLIDIGWKRVLAIDYGVINDFVILDCLIDPVTTITFVEDEFRFKGGNTKNGENKIPPTNELYVKFVKEIISKREGGRYSKLLYDPSARPFANTLSAHNIKCNRANNTVKVSRRAKKLDTQNQDKKVVKSSAGIALVKDGIGFNKIRINKKNCEDTVLELEGYAYDPKKLALGIEEPLKVRDHGVDVIRYVINTEIKESRTWLRAKKEEVDFGEIEKRIKETKNCYNQRQEYDNRNVEVSGKNSFTAF